MKCLNFHLFASTFCVIDKCLLFKVNEGLYFLFSLVTILLPSPELSFFFFFYFWVHLGCLLFVCFTSRFILNLSISVSIRSFPLEMLRLQFSVFSVSSTLTSLNSKVLKLHPLGTHLSMFSKAWHWPPSTLSPLTRSSLAPQHYLEWGEGGGETIYVSWLNIFPVTPHICSLPFTIVAF